MKLTADITLQPGLAADAYHPHLKGGRSTAAMFGVLWSSLQTLIPTISAAVIFFVSAFYLSPQDFGLVGLASSIVMTVIAFSPLAFGEAVVQRKTLTKEHADSVFWMTAVFGTLCYLPLAIGGSFIGELVREPAIAALFPILALRIPLDMLAAVPNAMIIRSMKFKLIALRTAVATLGSVTICLVLLLNGFGYWALVASQVTASLIACIMAFWVCGWRPGISARWSAIHELAGYGIFASGTRMLSTMKIDHLMLGILGGTTLLGLFILAQRLYNMLTGLVGGALSSVTLSLLSALQGDRQKTKDAFGIASFVAAAVSLPMFSLLWIVAPDLLALLPDPKWTEAGFALQAFCFIGVLACIGIVQSALINSQGKANWWFYYQLVQQGTSVLTIMLTYHFGLAVMMTVLVVKSALMWPVSVIMTTTLLECRVSQYLATFAAPLMATVVMALYVIAIPLLFPSLAGVPLIAVQVAVALCIYLPLMLLLSRNRIRLMLKLVFPKREPAL